MRRRLAGTILLNRQYVVTPICAKTLCAERQREGRPNADVSNSKGTDCSRGGSGWVLLSAPAFAQAHIRGTVTEVKDGTIGVQNAKGETISIKLASDAGLFLVTKADMSAIQSGKFVGITSFEVDGKRVAREVHVFDESLRGLAEGHYPWDLEAKPNMMTNANISKIEEVGTDRVVKVDYKGGEQTISIPTDATVVSFVKAPAAARRRAQGVRRHEEGRSGSCRGGGRC